MSWTPLRRRSHPGPLVQARRRPPEFIQVSEMDCGPAALASLLGAFDLHADVDSLRELAATDVDGTSVDALEEIAVAAGLDAEQVVVPWEQVAAVPDRYLPALLLTKTPTGFAHVVCVSRCRRGRVEICDPAIGRRSVRMSRLRDEVFVHELDAPVGAWEEYALSGDAFHAMVARLQGRGTSKKEAIRMATAARARGPLDNGVGGLLSDLDPPGSEGARLAVMTLPDDPGMVRVRGVVMVRARGLRRDAVIPESLRDVLASSRPRPLTSLLKIAMTRGRHSSLALLLTLVAAVAGILEVLSARSTLEAGVAGGRLDLLIGALVFAMIAAVGAGLAVAAVARAVEREMLSSLLAKGGFMGEMFSRTRPAGDLAERSHALREVREVVEMAGIGLQRGLELLFSCLAMAFVASATWPVAAILFAVGVFAPSVTVRSLREQDLRSRSLSGVLAQLLTDSLGNLRAVRTHRAATVVAAWQRPLLDRWRSASKDLACRFALVSGCLLGSTLLLAVVAAALAWRAEAGTARSLVILALGLTAATAASDVALTTRRLVSLRSVVSRLMDILQAPIVDPQPLASGPDTSRGSQIVLREVDLVLGGSPVLTNIDLTVRPGEHIAVVGASGSGKSTLLGLLGGWLTPTTGALTAGSQPLIGTHLAWHRGALAWSDPTARLPDATMQEVADEGAAEAAGSAESRLRLVDLDPARMGARSIGEAGSRLDAAAAQRLRLARALGRPDAHLVLLDEALRALSAPERATLLSRSREIWQESIIFHVTHDAAEALDFDRVLVMANGVIAEDSTPSQLSGKRGSQFGELLRTQRVIGERLGDPARWKSVKRAPSVGDAGMPERFSGVNSDEELGFRSYLPLGIGSIIGAFGATGVLLLAALLLGDAVADPPVGEIPWLPGSLVLMVAVAMLAGLGLVLDGLLAVKLGAGLRRRALTSTLSGDPGRLDGEGLGARLGRALDLEVVERAAQGTGALVSVGVAQLSAAVIALTVLVGPIFLIVLAVTIVAVSVLSLSLQKEVLGVNRLRRASSSLLLDRLLGHRTVTVYSTTAREDSSSKLMDELSRAERGADDRRVLLLTALPRVGAVLSLLALAASPPASIGGVTAALGAALLLLTGLERLAAASLAVTTGRAAWTEARPLLDSGVEGEEASLTDQPEDPMPEDLVALERSTGAGHPDDGRVATAPAPGQDVFYHQPFFANALLACRQWPPADADSGLLAELLAGLGLDDLVARMPNGLGQPLGQTGWQLSEGERARFSLLRALMSRPSTVISQETLSALDPHTAHQLLDLLEALPTSVILIQKTSA